MPRRKKIKRGIPAVPKKKVRDQAKTSTPKRPYSPAVLDFTPTYDVPDNTDTTRFVGVIAATKLQRESGGGQLIRLGNRWRPDDPRVNAQLQGALIDLGVQLATMNPLSIRTTVQTSSDGAYHLSWDNDPLLPGGFLITLQTPPDADITGGGATINGANASTLAAGSAATATIDSAGIVQIGVPRGDTGLTGSAGSNGSNGSPGVDGYTPTIASVVAVTLGYGSPSAASIVPDAPNTTNHTVPLHVAFGIPIGAPGSNGSNGNNGADGLPGIVSVANVDQDASLPDTLVYNSTSKVITLKRPGTGFTPTPDNTSCTICDVSQTIAAYVNAKFIDFQNQAEANVAAGLGLLDSIISIIGIIPLATGPTDAIVTMLNASNSFTNAAITSNNNTDFKDYIAGKLYCIMVAANTTVFSADVQAAWYADIIGTPTTITPTIFSALYGSFVANVLPIKAVQLAEKFSSTGHDCAAYDCSGSAPGTWSLFIDLRIASPTFTEGILSGTHNSTYGISNLSSENNSASLTVALNGGASDTVLTGYDFQVVALPTPSGTALAVLTFPGVYQYIDNAPSLDGIQTISRTGLTLNIWTGSSLAAPIGITVIEDYSHWTPPPNTKFAVTTLRLHGTGTPPTL